MVKHGQPDKARRFQVPPNLYFAEPMLEPPKSGKGGLANCEPAREIEREVPRC